MLLLAKAVVDILEFVLVVVCFLLSPRAVRSPKVVSAAARLLERLGRDLIVALVLVKRWLRALALQGLLVLIETLLLRSLQLRAVAVTGSYVLLLVLVDSVALRDLLLLVLAAWCGPANTLQKHHRSQRGFARLAALALHPLRPAAAGPATPHRLCAPLLRCLMAFSEGLSGSDCQSIWAAVVLQTAFSQSFSSSSARRRPPS